MISRELKATYQITQSALKASVEYEPATGIFRNLLPRSKTPRGKIIGQKVHRGYVAVQINGKRYYAHRLAFLYMTGAMPEVVDHINGDRSDNRWDNLRAATQTQNVRNSRIYRTNTSGAKGVCRIVSTRDGRQWRASIKVHGRHHSLGTHRTKQAAAAAYEKAAQQHFGEFARTK